VFNLDFIGAVGREGGLGEEDRFRVSLLLHGMMSIPANEQHCKVHSSCGENEMEETIAIWHSIFCLFLGPAELHIKFYS